MPLSAKSSFGPGGELKSQVQGIEGYAPSKLSSLGEYFKRYKPYERPTQGAAMQTQALMTPPTPSRASMAPQAQGPNRFQMLDSFTPTPEMRMGPQGQWYEYVDPRAAQLSNAKAQLLGVKDDAFLGGRIGSPTSNFSSDDYRTLRKTNF